MKMKMKFNFIDNANQLKLGSPAEVWRPEGGFIRMIPILKTLAQRVALITGALSTLLACSSDDRGAPSGGSRYVLGSVAIDADGNRTTYVQTIPSLEGTFTNQTAIELPGNGVLMAGGRNFFVGLAEEPTWVRYSVDASGQISETGRMSLAELGAPQIDYGNAYVDDQTAVSVFSSPAVAVIWNPSTMEVTKEVSLSPLERAGYSLEVWTTIAHDGLVYIPGRWANWDAGRIFPGVSLTILDPKAMKVLGTASDDRCASGGQVVFDRAGYGYVMGDGRNYSIQMFANANGGTAPQNCLLRIAPGATEFDPDYYYAIPSLTGGVEAIDELQTGRQGSGVGFAKMFYPDQLPDDVKPVDFDFWSMPAHKMWRILLSDPPSAEVVKGIPFSSIGFGGSALAGRLYTGESSDGAVSEVYETDQETNTAVLRFTMDGYFDGLYELAR